MNRRRLLWLAVAVVLEALALAVAFETGWLRWPWGGPEARARSVRLGMTESEVDALLGGPPGIKAPCADPEKGAPFRAGWRAVWYSDRGNVAVDFDAAGKVEAPAVFVLPRR